MYRLNITKSQIWITNSGGPKKCSLLPSTEMPIPNIIKLKIFPKNWNAARLQLASKKGNLPISKAVDKVQHIPMPSYISNSYFTIYFSYSLITTKVRPIIVKSLYLTQLSFLIILVFPFFQLPSLVTVDIDSILKFTSSVISSQVLNGKTHCPVQQIQKSALHIVP